MIKISRTINPSGRGETLFWDITSDRPFVSDGRRCEGVHDDLMIQADTDISDLPGALRVLGFEYVGHDDVRRMTFWSKPGEAA